MTLALLSVAIPMTAAAAGTTFHVSVSGSDSAGDGSAASPWKTLAHACQNVPADQDNTIQLGTGTFLETAVVSIPSGVNVAGSGKDSTTIKSTVNYTYGEGIMGYAEDKFILQAKNGAGNQTFRDFTLDGSNKQNHGGLFLYARSNVSIYNLHIQKFGFCGLWLWGNPSGTSSNVHAYNLTMDDNSMGFTGVQYAALMYGNLADSSIHDCVINEPNNYGMKALVYGPVTLNRLKIYNNTFNVGLYGTWAGGLAPNIALEMWNSQASQCEIYNNTFNNNLSIVGTSGSGHPSVRVHHNNFIFTSSVAYGIEADMDYLEIDHNYITGGAQPIAAWSDKRNHISIHHNVFDNISANYDIETIRFNDCDNLSVYNNTVKLSNASTQVDFVRLCGGGASSNVNIKNNIVWNTSGRNCNLVTLSNGSSVSSLTASHNVMNNVNNGASGSFSSNIAAAPQVTGSGAAPDPYYRPAANGNLVNAGADVGLSYLGSAPDIGAIESGEDAWVLGPIPQEQAPVAGAVNDSETGTGLGQFHFVGNWSVSSAAGAYMGDDHWSNTAGDYYQVAFVGTQIKVYSQKNSSFGILGVSIDGGAETLVDCYSATKMENTLIYTSPVLAAGTHTLKVRITGDKNASSAGIYNAADRVDIVNDAVTGSVNDSVTGTGLGQFHFVGSWSVSSAAGAYMGDDHWSNTAGDYYQVSFYGTQIKVYSQKNSSFGMLGVSIDGGAETVVDCYSGTKVENTLIYTSPVLAVGSHTLKVRLTGDKNPSAAGIYNNADRVEIINDPPAPVVEGDGLTGTYYNSGSALAFTRVDESIDFNWGSATPVGTGDFTVEWNGKLQPLYTEAYTFYGESSTGMRVTVNGTVVLDDWSYHSTRETAGTPITLTAGQKYTIKVEYYSYYSGASVAKLKWSSASQAKQIVPQAQLYSS